MSKDHNIAQINTSSGNFCGDMVIGRKGGVFPSIKTEKITGFGGTNVNGVLLKNGTITADSMTLGGYDWSVCKVTYLKQKDFESGTYRIRESGIYRFCEDVNFDPIPAKERSDKPNVGWFAGISVETNNVWIDLNGYTFQATPEFVESHIVKVFALIELGNAPFPGVPFPINTVSFIGETEFKRAQRVVISNGNLGLSSHHGIHGNGSTEVYICNLTISDYEVAGVTMNSCYNLYVDNCKFSGNRHTIVNRGRRASLQTLIKSIKLYPQSEGYAVHLAAAEALLAAELETSSQSAISIPDGNTYGIIIGASPASGGPRFNAAECAAVPNLGYQRWPKNINITNCSFADIRGAPNQQISLVGEVSVGFYSGVVGDPVNQLMATVHGGVFGGFLWNDFYPEGVFAPNDMAKALTWVLKQRRIELSIADSTPYFVPVGFEDNILSDTPNEGLFLSHVKPGFDFDFAHVNKGIFGMKLGCVDGGKISGCTVTHVRNEAPPSLLLADIPAGGNYVPADSGLNKRYIGVDAYGLSIEHCKNLDVSCCQFRDIHSENGYAHDIVVFGESRTVTIDRCDGKAVYSAADPETPDVPNPTGESYGILIDNSSGTRVINTHMRNVGAPRCAWAYLVQSGERNQIIDSECQDIWVNAAVAAGRTKHCIGFSSNTPATFVGCQASGLHVDGEGDELDRSSSLCRGFYINGPSSLMDSCTAVQNDGGAGTCHGVLYEGDNGYTTGVKTIKNYTSNNNGEGYGFVDTGAGNSHEDNKSVANSTAN